MTTGSVFTRRQVLAGGLAGAAAAVLATTGGSTAQAAARIPAAGADLGAVEHVVFLMMENRSFDHFYGTLNGVRGFDDHVAGNEGAASRSLPYPHAQCVVRGIRRRRGMLRAGALARRGASSCTPRGAPHLRRDRRYRPADASAAIQPIGAGYAEAVPAVGSARRERDPGALAR